MSRYILDPIAIRAVLPLASHRSLPRRPSAPHSPSLLPSLASSAVDDGDTVSIVWFWRRPQDAGGSETGKASASRQQAAWVGSAAWVLLVVVFVSVSAIFFQSLYRFKVLARPSAAA